MTEERSLSSDTLLAHAGFLRSLACELAGPSNAPDVLQDAWVAALERPPRERSALRSWLATVVANRARNARRGAGRRRRREEAAARPELAEPDALALERLELQRVLGELVVALPEEHRTVIYLRYYEGLTPTAIAGRLGMPVKTVKSRHTRALAALRARMDERTGGDRAAWIAVLVPRARVEPAAAGVPAMALATAALAVLAGWWMWRGLAGGGASATRESEARSSRDSTARDELASVAREPVAPSAAAPSVPSGAVLEGTVLLREDGSPVAGVAVEVSPRGPGEPRQALTDERGSFRLEWPQGVRVGTLTAEPTSATGRTSRSLDLSIVPGASATVELRVTRGAMLRGTVVDETGAPVAGAEVHAWCRRDFDPRRAPDRSALAEADGSFRIEHLGSEFSLSADSPGRACLYGLRGRLDGGAEVSGLEVVLQSADVVRGHVVDRAGRPISGAQLRMDPHMGSSDRDATRVSGVQRFYALDRETTSDASGAFELDAVPARRWNVRVTHPAFLFADATIDCTSPDNRIELDSGYAFAGRVLDEDGRPFEGAVVRVCSAGSGQNARSDANGRFEVRALAASENAFVLVKPDGRSLLARQPIRVGEGPQPFVELRLDRAVGLSGRVRDHEGRPLAGARLRVVGDRRLVYDDVSFDEPTTWEWAADRNETQSDAEGRFAFEPLYDGAFELTVSAADEPLASARFAVHSGDELDLVVDPGVLERVVLVGDVRDARSGAAVEEFSVSPARVQDDGSSLGHTHEFGVERQGRFRLSGLEPGRYRVSVSAAGYASWDGEVAEFPEGEHRLDVRLWPACAIEVVVHDDEGQSVGARLEFEDRDGHPLWHEWGGARSLVAHTGAEPRAVGGLPRAPVRVRASAPGCEDATFDLDLSEPPGEPVRLVLRKRVLVKRWFTVLGTEDPDLAGVSDLEPLRGAFDAGRVRSPDVAIHALFEDERGQRVAELTCEPLGPDLWAWSCALDDEAQSGEQGYPVFDPRLPPSVVTASLEVEGYVTQRVDLRVHELRERSSAVVLLRKR